MLEIYFLSELSTQPPLSNGTSSTITSKDSASTITSKDSNGITDTTTSKEPSSHNFKSSTLICNGTVDDHSPPTAHDDIAQNVNGENVSNSVNLDDKNLTCIETADSTSNTEKITTDSPEVVVGNGAHDNNVSTLSDDDIPLDQLQTHTDDDIPLNLLQSKKSKGPLLPSGKRVGLISTTNGNSALLAVK